MEEATGLTTYDYSIRCTYCDVPGSILKARCSFSVRCLTSASAYEIYNEATLLGTCKDKGDKLMLDGMNTIVCRDTAVICAKLHYPHIPFSDINNIPDALAPKIVVMRNNKWIKGNLPTLSPYSVSDKGLSTSVIVLIALSIILVLIGTGFAFYFIRTKRRQSVRDQG